MLFEVAESLAFASKTNIPTIVRAGWVSTPASPHRTFVWKRFHRLCDVVRRVFDDQGLSFENTSTNTQDVVRRMLFESVNSQMVRMIHQYRGFVLAAISETEFNYLMPYTDPYLCVDTSLLVDDETMQWVLDVFRLSPVFFAKQVLEGTCKLRGDQTRITVCLQLMAEDVGIDEFLRQRYRERYNCMQCAPLPMDFAMQLSCFGKTPKEQPQARDPDVWVAQAALKARSRARAQASAPYAPMFLTQKSNV